MYKPISQPIGKGIDIGNARFAGTGLRTRVTFAAVLPLVIILGLFTAIQYHRQREMMLSNLSAVADYSAQVVEENLLHQMQESDFESVQILLDSMSEREEIETVYILSPEGEILFAPGGTDPDLKLNNEDFNCQPCHELSSGERPGSVVVANAAGQPIFRSMLPLENSSDCSGCHEGDGRILGLLLTEMSMGPIAASLSSQLRENILWSVAMILMTILVVNIVLDRFVLLRLMALTNSVSNFGNDGQLLLPADDKADEIGRLTTAFRSMALRIEKRRQENQLLSERLRAQSARRGELLKRVIQAQEAERKRIARELHDDLGQTMGGLALRAEVLDRSLQVGKNGNHQQIGQIKEIISSITERMYDIILDLRPSTLDDLGLVPALRAHAQRLLEHCDLDFTIDGSGLNSRLPIEVETAVFRVFQEALNNTVRHADATKVHAVLACADGIFTGEFIDNGRGYDPETIRVNDHNGRGLGLLGMQERVLQCGGRLNISSEPGNGTRITIWIPLQKECYDQANPFVAC